jgi:hypothetical protein
MEIKGQNMGASYTRGPHGLLDDSLGEQAVEKQKETTQKMNKSSAFESGRRKARIN